jgi:cation diffusion facilitator CzcD-associated flavoprotein CzcO
MAVERTGKLLVVGAGPVGLGMANALKREGLNYEQVDADEGLGGNWRHGMHNDVHIVSSKRSTAYADYPMPVHYPDFPSRAQMLAYLEDYARANGLLDAITYGKKVERAWPRPDDTWHVVFADGEERIYKGVVVCNGHHWHRRYPEVPGTFAGRLVHSKDFRSPDELAGKRVLIVGAGNSGCDIADIAAHVASSCDLSVRSGYWFLPKTAFGRPLTDLPIWNLPVFLQRAILKTIVRIVIGDYRSYGLPKPNHRMFERHPAYGDEILGHLRQGRMHVRPDLTRYEGQTVVFKDGSRADYDVIVAATGFYNSFPFLPKGLIAVEKDVAQIYGFAFPDTAKNLYLIGTMQPRNGFGSLLTPAAKLYARLICMQDEIEHPIGYVLKWMGEKPPPTQLMDPGAARRDIWISSLLLPLLKVQARRLARRERRVPPGDAAAYQFDTSASAQAVN